MFFAEIKPQIEQLSHDELLKTMAYLARIFHNKGNIRDKYILNS